MDGQKDRLHHSLFKNYFSWHFIYDCKCPMKFQLCQKTKISMGKYGKPFLIFPGYQFPYFFLFIYCPRSGRLCDVKKVSSNFRFYAWRNFGASVQWSVNIVIRWTNSCLIEKIFAATGHIIRLFGRTEIYWGKIIENVWFQLYSVWKIIYFR